MKNFKFAALIILVFAIVLAACGQKAAETGADAESPEPASSTQTAAGSEPAKEPVKIRLGTVCGSTNPLLGVLAVEDGSLEKAGLHVEKVCFNSGADAVQALVGGSLDINMGSYEHVLRQRHNGLDVKAYANLYNGLGYMLVTKKDSPYQSAADLKNATLGVTKAGSLSDTALRMILEKATINPDRDVQIVSGGSGATMLAALESGKVAGGMVTDPTASHMVASGDYRILVDPPYAYVGLVAMAKTEWVAKNEEAMKTFLRVLKEVRDRAESDPKQAAEALAKEFEQISPDVLESAIRNELKKIPADLKITKEGADAVVQSQIELGSISQSIPFEDTIDLSLLPQ